MENLKETGKNVRPTGQPLWVTAPTAPQPGTHLRRILGAAGRGVTGSGYGSEGGAGFGPSVGAAWAANAFGSSPREADLALSGALTTRYGPWLNQFEPHERVAILYSISQGGASWAPASPIFMTYYTLAELNRPAMGTNIPPIEACTTSTEVLETFNDAYSQLYDKYVQVNP
jgi:hypothetical protein